MPEKPNARRVRAGALVEAAGLPAKNNSPNGGDRQSFGWGDWCPVIDLAERIFGRSVAAALWRESPLPRIDQLPMIEARFLEERVLRQTYGSLPAGDLFAAYESWCADKGCDPLTPSGFGRAMTRLGLERVKGRGGRIQYRHLTLRRRCFDEQ